MKNHGTMERWNRLNQVWDSKFKGVDAFLIKDSHDEESIKLKTLAFQNWLFRFEFTDSVLVLSPSALLVCSAKEKLDMLTHLVDKASKQGKEVLLVEKNTGAEDQTFEAVLQKLTARKLNRLGCFSKEKQLSPFIQNFERKFAELGFTEVDVAQPFQEFLSVKLPADIEIIETCAKANCLLFKRMVELIEDLLNNDTAETHAKISKKTEAFLKTHRAELEKKAKVKCTFLDFPYVPVVQSGNSFSLKIDADSNEQPLSQNYILLNMAVKYFEMNTNVFRTLLIDPSQDDRKHYNALCKVHDFLIQSLKQGVKCSEVYSAVVAFAQQHFPEIASALPQSFGFGIGFEFREGCLAISPKNDKTEIAAGHTFLALTSLKDLRGRKDVVYSMHLSDTVLVTESGPKNLTSSVPKKIEDVGYNLNEEVDEPAPKQKKKGDTKGAGPQVPSDSDPQSNSMAPRTRLAKRMEEINREQNEKKRIKEHQKELLRVKSEELEERLKSGNFTYQTSESQKIVLEKIKAYTPETFPSKLNPNNVHVDVKRACVMLPVNKELVPFHVSCIKNVTKHSENKLATLRFNFFTPGISSGNITFPNPEAYGSQLVYIKELTFRSANIENFNQIAKDVKELQKKLKSAPSSSADQANDKFTLANKLKFLNDIKMRPAMMGRKTVGTLIGYENGFRFTNKTTNENFDVSLANVKHALLQLCDQDMIVIIHLALESPVRINNKSYSHVQFYTEVGFLSEDLNDPRRKNRGHDLDEFEEEELEKQAREYYNKMFLEFCTYMEKHWKSPLKFDSPFPELSFYGSPFYNNVVISPASNCLVSLIEQPFLVVSYSDIEIVSLERVDSQIKNFDLIVVFKDFTKPVQTISNIPKKKLEMIKVWLDDKNILFIEGGTMNLKWETLLKKIRTDPENFIREEKGWKAFFSDTEEEEQEEAEGESSDSEFKSEEEEEEEEEDDEEDGDDDEDDDDFDEDEELDDLVDDEGELTRR